MPDILFNFVNDSVIYTEIQGEIDYSNLKN